MSHQLDDSPCPTGATCTTKWGTMTTALERVVTDSEGDLNWGVKFFSNDDACRAAGSAEVGPGPNAAAAVASYIAVVNPRGGAPTSLAVQAAVSYLKSLSGSNAKYVLLATDGEADCCATAGDAGCSGSSGGPYGGDDAPNAIAAIAAAYDSGTGIPVLVAGIGTPASEVSTLNAMANAGGRAQLPDTLGRVFLAVNDTASLQAGTLRLIVGMTACTATLGSSPPDPTNIAVLVGGVSIPEDPVNGWSYGPGMRSLAFSGTSCDMIVADQAVDIQVVFGCPSCPIKIP